MEGILVTFGSYSILIHQSIVIWFGILVFVGILLTWGGKKIKKADPTVAPKGAVLFFEIIAGFAMGIIGGNLNKRTWKYLPFMGTVMLCMLISNLMGLLGLQPPTSNLSVNITLAMMMIVLIHGTDIKNHGIKGKLKNLCEPMVFLFPLNVIGDIALPVSLSLRLFGNMLGGTIITSLLYMLIRSLLPFSIVSYAITPFLHMYFDIFTACMQTYIFFMLASFFLSQQFDE